MSSSREAETLLRLWQQLQEAQVAGDEQQLASLRRLAEAQSRQPGASAEWELLAREAGRHTARAREQAEAEPTAGVGAEATMAPAERADEELVGEVLAPDGAPDATGDEARNPGGRRVGPIIWVVILFGYLVLQLIGRLTNGDG